MEAVMTYAGKELRLNDLLPAKTRTCMPNDIFALQRKKKSVH